MLGMGGAFRVLTPSSSLVRFVDNYRDPHEGEGEEEFDEQTEKRPWWAFWKGGKAGYASTSKSDFATPTDWVKTDMKQGLSSLEVERRRKQYGWNELTAEKENMLLKFIGFFRGPVLYGKSCLQSLAMHPGASARHRSMASWRRRLFCFYKL